MSQVLLFAECILQTDRKILGQICFVSFELGLDEKKIVLMDVHEMAKIWKVLCKQYVSTEKILKSPNISRLFCKPLSDCSHYPYQNNIYLLLPKADICHQLKASHNTTKYAPYLGWSHGEKLSCLIEMNISVLGLIIGQHDPVDFIFA